MVIVRQHSVEADRRATQARRWRIPWIETIAALIVVIGTVVFLYPHMASWFSQKEQSRVTALALERMNDPPNNDAVYRNERIEEAQLYNDALSSGAIYQANEHIAVGSGSSSDERFVYEDMLNTTGTGYMGRIKYDALAIDLPIYHGTSDDTLTRGVGHLEGTSLPVGGEGNRAVLTAHRGLPEATLFNELDKAAVGDVFSLTVLDQVLTYRVTDTQVIEPNETEAILPVIDRDMVTLVTCTPLDINTHRILVNAERITPTPIGDLESGMAVPELPGFPWWIIVLGGVTLIVSGFVWRAGYRPTRISEGVET